MSRQDERANYHVYTPADTPPGKMVRAVGGRWRIETAIEEAEGLASPRGPHADARSRGA